MAKKRLYIAYGSNMNLTQMAYRCPTARPVGTAELSGFELLFRGGWRGTVATDEPKDGSSVPVLVWEIKPDDEAALDRYEGFPRLYGKRELEVNLKGKQTAAMVYVMTPGYMAGMPSRDYLAAIAAGYRSAGFDCSVLKTAVKRSSELMELEEEAWRQIWSREIGQEINQKTNQEPEGGRAGFSGMEWM